METNKAPSSNAGEQTNLEELMSHHHLRGEPSLRELQKDYQIVYKESQRLQDKVEESQANQVILNASHSDIESAERDAKTKMDQNIQYTTDLQQQQKEWQHEGSLIKNKIQEGIVKTIADEQGREFQMRQVAFDDERQEKKHRQREIAVEDERQRVQHNHDTDDRSATIIAEREKKIVERGNQSKILGDKLVAGGVARQEHEDLINMHQKTERFDKMTEQDEHERERVEWCREEIEKSNISQFRFKQHAAGELKMEEDRFRRESDKRLALQDELELEKDRKKKEKNHQYSLDLQEQIAGNARRRLSERKAEQTREQDRFDSSQEWRAHAPEGRRTFLEEYNVPQQVSGRPWDVEQFDDNVRENERQLSMEEESELEKDRKKKEKNHQYFLDLQEQIAGNARRRQADKEFEQSQFDCNQQWQVSEERKKILEERDMNAHMEGSVDHDAQPVDRMRADKLEDVAEYKD